MIAHNKSESLKKYCCLKKFLQTSYMPNAKKKKKPRAPKSQQYKVIHLFISCSMKIRKQLGFGQ